MKLGNVDYHKAMTPREEYCYLREKLDVVSDMLPSDEYRRRLHAAERLYVSVLKKLEKLLDSDGFKE